ncbi:MAG TPA: hypothetical protein VGA37_12175 [Gemmatimonadales bacterium]
MRASALVLSCLACAGPAVAPVYAQTIVQPGLYRDARSAAYLFAASSADARTLWVNPGGLGIRLEASVMGEIVVERDLGSGDYSIAQYSAGFNSRGVSFGYRRDRFDSAGGNTFRLGAGRAMGRIAVGAALSLYSGDPDQRELDLGLRYALTPTIEIGTVMRHILRPVVRQTPIPVTGTAGLHWQVGAGLGLDAEATAADRFAGSGFDMSYRAGVQFGGGRLPALLLANVDLDSDLGIGRFVAGLAVGGADRGVLIGDMVRTAGTTRLSAISLAGIATRSLVGPNRRSR